MLDKNYAAILIDERDSFVVNKAAIFENFVLSGVFNLVGLPHAHILTGTSTKILRNIIQTCFKASANAFESFKSKYSISSQKSNDF